MPTVYDLIKGRQFPTCVKAGALVSEALELMIENDFSQLPIIDETSKPIGLITGDSILRGLNNFRASITKLKVNHVAEKAKLYFSDNDIFEVLEGLKDQPAALIVDNEKRLIGIITHYDTTQYFRRRAEDIILVEDIETTLREHIEAAFTDAKTGELDENDLQAAISELTDSTEQTLKKFKGVLKKYFNLAGISHKPNSQWIDEACEDLVDKNRTTKHFDDLTLYQYTELLFHESRWSTYGANFSLGKEHIRNMLNSVRDTRNTLAHFRGDISNKQRKQLHDCRRWLEQNRPYYPPDAIVTDDPPHEPTSQSEIIPVEELDETDSRYTQLILHLQRQPHKLDKIRLTFEEIERVMGYELPPSARNHRAWWANDSSGHGHSKQWLAVDWRISSIDMSNEKVIFTRMREGEQRYINFFSEFLEKTRKTGASPISEDISSNGAHWINLMGLPRKGGRQSAALILSFRRSRRFDVELYIETPDKAKNKAIFDKLYAQCREIEQELGKALSWERLDNKQPSRIALYYPDSANIMDSPEELAQIQEWAVEATIAFEKAITEKAEVALKAVL